MFNLKKKVINEGLCEIILIYFNIHIIFFIFVFVQNPFSDAGGEEKGSELKGTLPQTSKMHEKMVNNSSRNMRHKYCYSKREDELKNLNLPKRKFRCTSCNYESNCKTHFNLHLLTHLDIHLNSSNYSCECNGKEDSERDAPSHQSLKYRCCLCGFDYTCQKKFDAHILTHQKMKYNCSSCNYESKLKSDLKQHMLTHKNIKFKCSECCYKSDRREDLKRHEYTHQNVSKLSDLTAAMSVTEEST